MEYTLIPSGIIAVVVTGPFFAGTGNAYCNRLLVKFASVEFVNCFPDLLFRWTFQQSRILWICLFLYP